MSGRALRVTGSDGEDVAQMPLNRAHLRALEHLQQRNITVILKNSPSCGSGLFSTAAHLTARF